MNKEKNILSLTECNQKKKNKQRKWKQLVLGQKTRVYYKIIGLLQKKVIKKALRSTKNVALKRAVLSVRE